MYQCDVFACIVLAPTCQPLNQDISLKRGSELLSTQDHLMFGWQIHARLFSNTFVADSVHHLSAASLMPKVLMYDISRRELQQRPLLGNSSHGAPR